MNDDPEFGMELNPAATVGVRLLDSRTLPFNIEDHLRQLTEFIDYFRNAVAEDRGQIVQAAITGNANLVRMISYAAIMASRAVQNNSTEDIRRGLAAVVLAGDQVDYRYSLMVLSILYHSAEKLGISPAEVFTEAARLGTSETNDFLMKYLAHGEKSIEAMGYKEGAGPDGAFKYIVEPPPDKTRSRIQ
ncbi:MAG TPA: hypothetical protein VMD30_11240 [Tepidisphaeraceae bacterium]|nr:hypothetical protein [Tepidisphaeraceae bacterium]